MFVLASVGCALSTSMPMLLVFRALQGLSAGVGMIVGRAVIRDVLQGDDAQRLMSQVSMIFGIAPAVAPIIGGWIVGWSQWQAIFWFLAVFAAVLWVVTACVLPETHPPEARMSPAACRLAAQLSRASSAIRVSCGCRLPVRSTSARCSCTSPRRLRSCWT